MNPVLMGLILVGFLGAFTVSALRRWRLLQVGRSTDESRTNAVPERLWRLWTFGLYQKKMRYYLTAGLAHQLIFIGFGVLLFRTLVLWGRGFDPAFNLFVLGPDTVLGQAYGFAKDLVALLVICGALVFVYYRTLNHQKRMSLSVEGLVILGIIITMMVSDVVYDGASLVLAANPITGCGTTISESFCAGAEKMIAPLAGLESHQLRFNVLEPAGSAMSLLLSGLGIPTLVVLGQLGFWLHSTLVLVFLNLLPFSKHFHVITALPNVFLSDITPPGRLRPLATSTEALMGMVETAMEQPDKVATPIGYSRIQHFTWKDVLDFYSCTECGRCSDNCPAFITGKKLSPKHFTLDLRNHLYHREHELVAAQTKAPGISPGTAQTDAGAAQGAATSESTSNSEAKPGAATHAEPIELVPAVIDPDVLWACTSCRACEEQCPVLITYVDKIVAMRRNLVVIKGEFPSQLAKPFEGMEVNGNPWNLARVDRKNWAEGLNVPLFSERPAAQVLYWVGCAASYDDRAKKIARATAELLITAGVDFAILGEEESCTGDPARRAGNEYLFTMLAEGNVATLNGYRDQGGVKTIITTCPHCFNTLLNEYPDFGGKYEVVHHTDYLLGLVAQKKLVPSRAVAAKVTYHDSCYLGRYNGIYESPREILRRIPGVELVEVEHWKKEKGLCCGAGGAQMWMEEQNKDRINVKRTLQLLNTGATTIASACPFCMTMLSDGLKAHEKEASVQQLDVVELLARSCRAAKPESAAAE